MWLTSSCTIAVENAETGIHTASMTTAAKCMIRLTSIQTRREQNTHGMLCLDVTGKKRTILRVTADRKSGAAKIQGQRLEEVRTCKKGNIVKLAS